MQKKILFLIHDLGQGGAEKVLINLVNNMDRSKFRITVMSLFGGGVNERFLAPDVEYKTVWKKPFPKNSLLMQLLTPESLHRLCIKETYDIEVAYLEGPTTRVISGCPNAGTKLFAWIHGQYHALERYAAHFRSEKEFFRSYQKFNSIVAVSADIKTDLENATAGHGLRAEVLYNTVESDKIRQEAAVPMTRFSKNEFNLLAVGSLKEVKGFDRLIRVHKRLRDDGISVHTYILGKGPLQQQLEHQTRDMSVQDSVTLLGYDTNPYKYYANADVYVCSSYSEGFSTAATESLIVGTPVCTTRVSGMEEMLGEGNQYGIITENDEDALYRGLKELLSNRELLAHYKKQAAIRGESFSTKTTVEAVERLLDNA